MNIPDVAKAFFEADRRNDAGSVARTFAVDAVVVDEGAFHQGGAAIRDWWAEAKRKTQYVAEPLDATVNGNRSFVRAKVSGRFPGSPVTLSYTFAITNDKIAKVEIR
jgi:ketosteroid isomerase-like protein